MSEEPELRSGPPWAMQEMIEAEPALVEPILNSPAAAEAGALVRAASGPVVLAGCGTSEHAAMGGAELLGGAARAADAFEASLDPQEGGVLIGVSHEGGTAATLAALRVASQRGAQTVLITARPERAPAGPLVVATPLVDRSWCHTVGYLSPLLALHAIAGGVDVEAARLAVTDADRPALAGPAAQLAGCERLLAVASGADAVTASELALKIEEGAHVPVTPLGVEKVLHGHLPATDARTGLILLRFDPRHAQARDARAREVAAAAAEIGLPTVTLSAPATSVATALLAGALALQWLTLELVHARGTNPDLIRREEPRYRAAAEAAGAG
jgi:glutamine---fructose-6-phosphate transaminase (isomerizing)